MKVHRIHLPSVDSTNTYAKANLRSLPRGSVSVITADEQTAGRGRLGRQWKSTGQDIVATFAFHVPTDRLPTAYQLSPLMALVARRALRTHGIAAQVKWPNDLIVSGCKKVGGILCEMDSLDGQYWAALGLGVNVNSAPEDFGVDRPVWPLTTLRAEGGGKAVSVTTLTDALVTEFAAALPDFLAHGFAPFQREYEAASLLLGKRIRFRDGGSLVTGVAYAVGADGKLMVRLEGKAEPAGFLSGEVTGVEMLDPATGPTPFFVEEFEEAP